MTSVTELSLHDLPIGEEAFAADPMPEYTAARRRHPWLAASPFGYVVTEYQAMKDVLAMDDVLRSPAPHIVSIMGGEGTAWGEFQVENLNARFGEDHARIRNSVNAAFTPRSVKGHRDRMRAAVTRVLDEWAPKGAFDFADFAANFPISVMAGLIGAPHSDVPKIMWMLEAVGQSFNLDRDFFPTLSAAYDAAYDYVDQLILARKAAGATGHGDLLDDMIAAETAGRLTSAELRQMLIFLFAAGYDTSKNMLGHIMRIMLDRPELWRRCAEDRPFCDKVVEETLRHTSVSTMYRDVHEAFEFRGVTFPKGVMLIFPLSLAGRDAGFFPDPMTFDPERVHTNRHLAFGRGVHICLGQFLARAQIEEGVHLIAQRITNPKLAGEVKWRPFPGVWGMSSLPIEFTPQLARPEGQSATGVAA